MMRLLLYWNVVAFVGCIASVSLFAGSFGGSVVCLYMGVNGFLDRML